MDIFEMLASGLISGLFVFFSGYVMFKIAKNNVKNEIFDFIESEDGQKLIYGLGALAANGAKAGLGLSKSGGKFSFKDLAMGIAGKWLEKSGWLGSQDSEVLPPRNITPKHLRTESPLDRE